MTMKPIAIVDSTDRADGKVLAWDATGTVHKYVDASAVSEITDLPTAETDTALVLAPDGAGGVEFRAEVGGGGITSGTSFPGSPADNDLFYRTDLDLLFFYDGTRWLTTSLFTLPIPVWAQATSGIVATQGSSLRGPIPPISGGSDFYIVQSRLDFVVSGGTALSGSHKWVVTLNKTDTSFTETAIDTVTIDSGASSVYRETTSNINALLGTTSFDFRVNATKTGTPGTLFILLALTYRIVAA